MLIQSDERNREKWKLGIVVKLIKGRDGVVRPARLRAGNPGENLSKIFKDP